MYDIFSTPTFFSIFSAALVSWHHKWRGLILSFVLPVRVANFKYRTFGTFKFVNKSQTFQAFNRVPHDTSVYLNQYQLGQTFKTETETQQTNISFFCKQGQKHIRGAVWTVSKVIRLLCLGATEEPASPPNEQCPSIFHPFGAGSRSTEGRKNHMETHARRRTETQETRGNADQTPRRLLTRGMY